jgi:hypothetical protein
MTTAQTILRLVERVQEDENRIGVLSTGERLAVALVLDRKDLLGGYTMLEAVNRLGDDWLRASIAVQRSMS